jgi:hypothetical protein
MIRVLSVLPESLPGIPRFPFKRIPHAHILRSPYPIRGSVVAWRTDRSIAICQTNQVRGRGAVADKTDVQVDSLDDIQSSTVGAQYPRVIVTEGSSTNLSQEHNI